MGKSVYLSPSVQNWNIGASNYGSEEYRCNQIADITEKELKRHGIKVYRNDPKMSLTKVVSHSNNCSPEIHVAIHTNAFDKTVRGTECYCHKYGANGEKLAKALYNFVSKLTPVKDRGVKESYKLYNGKPMYETAYTNAPAALVEVEFHDNEKAAKWIIKNIENLGIAIAKGILQFFGIAYKEETIIEKGTYYRVVTGSFNEKENALKQVELLKKRGIGSFIAVYKK